MLVVQPEWVTHGGNPVWSIDISPDGTRLATAGGDTTIKIWSTADLFDEDKKGGDQGTEVLSVIKSHQAGVNCVRFSHNGRYLASASDDLHVGVFERKLVSGLAGSEHWTVVTMMLGHKVDISDLAWSPDDRYIATASFDSTVIVWDAERFVQLAQLGSPASGALGPDAPPPVGHAGWVRGLAWDPLGKYLASQGEDKTVIIWRTSDWAPHTFVRKPFRNATGSLLFRRLSWSPDGEYVATTNAFKKPSHVASVLARSKNFEVSHDFVGHETPVVVARFNPVIFRREEAETGQTRGYTVCAIGSQDAMISVWATHSSRPIVIAQDVFTQSIVDIAWGPDGYTLACCSTDGSVALFRFAPEELGKPLTAVEKAKILSDLYGDVTGTGAAVPLAETPDLLGLEQRNAARRAEKAAGGGPEASLVDSPPSSRPAAPAPAGPSHQIESRTSDGRRRITPQVLASVPLASVAAAAAASSPSPQPAVPAPRPASSSSPQPGTSGSKAGTPSAAASNGPSPPSSAASGVPPPSSSAAKPPEQPSAKRKAPPGPAAPVAKAPGQQTPVSSPAQPAKKGRPASQVASPLSQRPPAAGPSSSSAAAAAATAASAEAPALAPAARTAPLLPLPPPKNSLSRQLTRTPGYLPPAPPEGSAPPSDAMSFLEASVSPVPPLVSTVRCTSRGTVLWSDRVYARACALAGNTGVFSACAFGDGTLLVYTPAGRRAMPPLALGSPAALLECGGGAHLLAITSQGNLWLWDVPRRACLVEGSVAPLLAAAPPGTTVERAAVEEATGSPVVTLSSGESFLWSGGLRAWLRVADAQGIHSDFFTTAPHGIGTEGRGPLAALQARAGQGAGAGGAALAAGRAHQAADTLSHLEGMLASAEAMQSAPEYRRWVRAYARRLAEAAEAGKLRELCDGLLGPGAEGEEAAPGGPAARGWRAHLFPGLAKRAVLEEDVLPQLATTRAVPVQRLLADCRAAVEALRARAAAAAPKQP